MDWDLIIPSAVAVVAIGLYVVALWIGDHRTISVLAVGTNALLLLIIAVVGMSWCLGVRLSISLILNPNNWLSAIGRMLREL